MAARAEDHVENSSDIEFNLRLITHRQGSQEPLGVRLDKRKDRGLSERTWSKGVLSEP